MKTFFVGMLSSLAAMLLSFLVVRWRWPALLSRVSGSQLFAHGVEFKYQDQAAAERDMRHDFHSSSTVQVLCMRAFSVVQIDRPFSFLMEAGSTIDLRLLIADPGDASGDNPFLVMRGKEYKGLDPADYRADVYSSVKRIREAMKANTRITCRLHVLPACHRLYICDDRAYVSFFTPYLSGSQLPIVRVRRSSVLYEGMKRYFQQCWAMSREISDLNFDSTS